MVLADDAEGGQDHEYEMPAAANNVTYEQIGGDSFENPMYDSCAADGFGYANDVHTYDAAC